jgi:hypothetical protein
MRYSFAEKGTPKPPEPLIESGLLITMNGATAFCTRLTAILELAEPAGGHSVASAFGVGAARPPAAIVAVRGAIAENDASLAPELAATTATIGSAEHIILHRVATRVWVRHEIYLS